MTSVALSPPAIFQFLNNAGQMNAGGKLLTQVGGVNYPTWQDAAAATALPNPIPLNSRGEISNTSGVSCELFLAAGVSYTFTLYDANGNSIWIADNVTAQGAAVVGSMTDEEGIGGTPGFAKNVDFTPGTTTTLTLVGYYGSASNLWVAFDGDEQGADSYSLNGYVLTFNAPIPVGVQKVFVKGGTTLTIGTPGAGTVTDLSVASGSRLYDRIYNIVDVKDFGCKGDGTTDDTANFQAAENYAAANGKSLFISPGTYSISNIGITKADGVSWFGSGKKKSILKAATAAWNGPSLVSGTATTSVSFFDVGFDGTGMTSSGLPGLLAIGSFSNGEVAFCDFNDILSVGILFSGGSNFSIHDNSFSKSATINTLNEAIWVRRTVSIPTLYSVKDNILTNIGTDFDGTDVSISGNIISSWGYGAGITVEQGASRFQIENNNCSSGVGVDINGVYPMGIENWASFSNITGNICNFNSGTGIMQGGAGCAVNSNVCINNGQNAAGSPIYRAGITSRYVSSIYNGGTSSIVGNVCLDTGGGTQQYGYVDDGPNVSGITLANNIFDGALAPMDATGTRYDFKGPKLTATLPNVAGFTVATMTSGGGGAAIALSGAQIGDKVTVSIGSSNMQGLIGIGWVPAANQVSYSFFNPTGGSVTVPIYTADIAVEKPFSYANY